VPVTVDVDYREALLPVRVLDVLRVKAAEAEVLDCRVNAFDVSLVMDAASVGVANKHRCPVLFQVRFCRLSAMLGDNAAMRNKQLPKWKRSAIWEPLKISFPETEDFWKVKSLHKAFP